MTTAAVWIDDDEGAPALRAMFAAFAAGPAPHGRR
jgi:hypothetical protein